MIKPTVVLLAAFACIGLACATTSPTPPVPPAPTAELQVASPAAAAEVVPAAAPPVEAAAPVEAPEPEESVAPEARVASATVAAGNEGEAEDDLGDPSAEETETIDPSAAAAAPGLLYTADIPDEVLSELWTHAPEKLGSVSFGYAHEGRLLNAVQFPKGEGWIVVSPAKAWGTQETIDYVITAIRAVREQFPDAPPLRVNQISAPEGGHLRPHKSHQAGRDVDLGFFYPTAEPVRVREREKYIDVPKNWALVKALITRTDVQLILVDRRVQKVLYDYALSVGEDKAWLDSIFRAGANSLVKHARRHRDHFHVRFYNGRAQELGRRLTPLLAQRPEQNIAIHRVRSGDTLSEIAVRYNSTVSAIRKANGIRGDLLRIRQVLKVPMRGPCTRCPLPPAVVVPPRRLPPLRVSQPVVDEPIPSQEATASPESDTPAAATDGQGFIGASP